MTTAAQKIADELIDICTEERLREFASDDSGNDSLEQHRSLVQIRLGGSYRSEAWDKAMDLLREQFAAE